jgi:hypothetical protein
MASFELRSCPSGLQLALVGRLVSLEKVLIEPIQPNSGCFSNAQHYWGHETSEPFSLTFWFARVGWMRWRDDKRGIALFFDRDRNKFQLFQRIWWHSQYVQKGWPKIMGAFEFRPVSKTTKFAGTYECPMRTQMLSTIPSTWRVDWFANLKRMVMCKMGLNCKTLS